MSAKLCRECGKPVRTEFDTCFACRSYPADRELEGGHWEKRGLVSVFVQTAKKRGRRQRPDLYEWTTVSLCEAHRLFAAGERDERTREGERVYHRIRKQEQRAAVKRAESMGVAA